MKGEVARALWALTLASACACGLEKGGLQDTDADPSGDDGVTKDATFPDQSSSDDSGENAEGTDDSFEEFDSDAETNDAPTTPHEASTSLDGSVDAASDATTPDKHSDAAHPTSDGRAPSDARPDVEIQPDSSEVDEADSSEDARPDTGPLPIVWDGGALPNPQLDNTNWASFCVALAACGEVTGVSACVALQPQPSSPDTLFPTTEMVNNVNNAAPDCAQVAVAVGGGSACPSTTADSCDGNLLSTCRWGFAMKVDCASVGLVCSSGDANAGCGFGDCAASQEGETYCVGTNYLAKCSRGRYEPAVDCETFGGACVGPPGAAHCAGAGGSTCNAGGACVGTTIVECVAGFFGSVDCSQLYNDNLTCFANDGGLPVCAVGQACNPSLATDTCNRQQTQVRFCNEGMNDTYDCTGNGYSGCDAGKCFP